MKKLIYTLTMLLLTIGAFAQLTVSINANPDTICLGSSTTLTANVTGGSLPYSYSWSNSQYTSAITVSPTVITIYTVTVRDNNSVTNTAQKVVIIKTEAYIAIPSWTPSVCKGGCISLYVINADDQKDTNRYIWNTGATTWSSDTAASHYVVCPTVTTTYYITATDGKGCTSSFWLSVYVNTTPAVNITMQPVGQAVQLCATPYSSGMYTWSDGTTMHSPAYCINVPEPTVNTTYCVTVYVSSGCTNSSCCIVVADNTKELNKEDSELKIFFNPTNDIITIEISQTEKTSKIIIYNITGEQLIKRQATDNKLQINIGILPKGIYIIKLITNKTVMTKKFLKE